MIYICVNQILIPMSWTQQNEIKLFKLRKDARRDLAKNGTFYIRKSLPELCVRLHKFL